MLVNIFRTNNPINNKYKEIVRKILQKLNFEKINDFLTYLKSMFKYGIVRTTHNQSIIKK